MRNPRDFYEPLAIGAPDPAREIPFKPSRMIHFMDFSNEKMVAKAPELAPKVDILLGNLEDAISVDKKVAAREGLIRVGREMDLGETALWTRVNELASPWVLDDITQLVTQIGERLEVVMVPKVEGPWDIHYVDRLLAQLEAKAELERPILIHCVLETAQGVSNLEEIAAASPRIQGMSLGPADLAASRRMKTTRVGGGHPGYRTIADPDPDDPGAPRPSYQQDPWHYSIARMVDACTSVGALPFYGPYGDISDEEGCQTQFRASFLKASPPTTLEGIERYLASGMIRGIGPVYAKRLVRGFGEAVFDLIEQQPERLREVSGIGAKRAAFLFQAFNALDKAFEPVAGNPPNVRHDLPLVLVRLSGEGGLLLGARLFLVLFAPFVIGHAVDDLARLRVGKLDALVLGRGAVPFRQAVAAEPGEVHQVDVLHVGALAQMRDEGAKGRGFKFGARLVVDLLVHRDPPVLGLM